MDDICGTENIDRDRFLVNINSIDPCIQFTVEETRADGSMLLLDTLVISEPERCPTTTM